MQQYYFANAKVHAPDLEVPPDWQSFTRERPYDFEIQLSVLAEEPELTAEQVTGYGRVRVAPYEEGWMFAAQEDNWTREEYLKKLNGQDIQKKLYGCLYAKNQYLDCVFYEKQNARKNLNHFHPAFDAALPFHGGSIVHASCIRYQEQALLFCGPSGMGKSTQAMLWERYRNTDMLSSDAPAVVLENGGARAYGMPWDGSDHIIRPDSAPVAAVIELRQAKQNHIRTLTAAEAFEVMMKQGHLPLWDKEAMLHAMVVLKKIAETVPFYRLECRPDEEAVELAEKMVFRS